MSGTVGWEGLSQRTAAATVLRDDRVARPDVGLELLPVDAAVRPVVPKLAVWRAQQDGRVGTVAGRAVEVCAQQRAVPHRHLNVVLHAQSEQG